MLELGAAQAWGIMFDPTGETPGSWLTLPREARKSMTAHYSLSRLTQTLLNEEHAERAKAEAKAARTGKRR